MATNTAPASEADDEVVHDYGLVRVYKSGRVERPLVAPPVPPGLDAATGVESRDVQLGAYSVRLYLPAAVTATAGAKAAKLPAVVYVHGGGFVAESAASPGCHRFLNRLTACHRFLNRLTAACPALGVSVKYRLAPEHPLPVAYEDCLAALKWALSAADPWATWTACSSPGTVPAATSATTTPSTPTSSPPRLKGRCC